MCEPQFFHVPESKSGREREKERKREREGEREREREIKKIEGERSKYGS